MSAIMDMVKPDLSRFVKDGQLDAEDAFSNYLCTIQRFIFPAIQALKESMPDCEFCGSALDTLEALDKSSEAMEEELIRVRNTVKAA